MWNDAMKSFLNNIDSLEIYVQSVEPALAERDMNFIKENKELADTLRNALKILSEENTDEISENEDIKITIDNDKKSVSIDIKDKEKIKKSDIDKFFKHMISGKSNYDILYKSALMNLVIYLESMIADIFRINFNKYPESVVNKKTLTFEEIKSIGSFEEATNYIIEKEIESKMYGSFMEWCEFLKKNLKLKIVHLDSMKDEITEIITRRNLFVHNRGIVNQVYLSKVHKNQREGIDIGTQLSVDRNYIDDAINKIEEFGILLIIEIWITQERNNANVINEIADLAYEFMEEEKWAISMNLYNMILNNRVKGITAKDKLQYKINYWQSLKWLGKYEDIKGDIEKEDFSAYTSDFRLCVHAIKDEFDEFYTLLERVYNKDISKRSLEEWPIFREIRQQEEYREFIAKVD